ncbi:hypothetical protein PENSPDRAFT_694157 [Peniophora sp. CONT]|nr:hypothetical protein PENSPDRAFT_694157 [Peniophora sp. CONT]
MGCNPWTTGIEKDADGQWKRRRTWSEMYSGTWWWDKQIELEAKKAGATIISLIISSDKTLLTQFRNRSAYPVYLTIGNLDKDLRRNTTRGGPLRNVPYGCSWPFRTAEPFGTAPRPEAEKWPRAWA